MFTANDVTFSSAWCLLNWFTLSVLYLDLIFVAVVQLCYCDTLSGPSGDSHVRTAT